MARSSLRRYDVQARYGIVLACASVVPCLGAFGMALRNYNSDIGHIVYGRSMWMIAFIACVGLALLIGGTGCLLGLNSAGQRRNEKQRWSWIAFFLGGSVTTLGIILAIAFFVLRVRFSID